MMENDPKNKAEGNDNHPSLVADDHTVWLSAQNENVFAENTRVLYEIAGDRFGGETIKGRRTRNEDVIGFVVCIDEKKIFGLGDGFDGGGRVSKLVVKKALESAKSLYVNMSGGTGDTQETEVVFPEEQKTPQTDMDTEVGWLVVEKSEDWRSVSFVKRLLGENLLHIEGVVVNEVMGAALNIRDKFKDIQKNLLSEIMDMGDSIESDGFRENKSGSTLVVAVNDPEAEALTILWNGDSRVYGVTTDGEVVKLTEDHTPKSNDPKFKKAVINVFVAREKTGVKPEILILGGEEYKKYKYFVLASDGVWSNNVDPEKVIGEAVSDEKLSEKEMAHKIVMGAFDAGSSDNISAVVVRR